MFQLSITLIDFLQGNNLIFLFHVLFLSLISISSPLLLISVLIFPIMSWLFQYHQPLSKQQFITFTNQHLIMLRSLLNIKSIEVTILFQEERSEPGLPGCLSSCQVMKQMFLYIRCRCVVQ